MTDTITLPRSVVQGALEALKYGGLLKRRQAITALREVVEKPQEKYTWGTPLLDAMAKDYTTPRREWVGLTLDEWREIDNRHDWRTTQGRIDATEEVAAKLKEKNA